MKDTRLIIAPRHPERFSEVETVIEKSGLKFSRRTTGLSTAQRRLGVDVLLLDTIGELMSVYSIADIAIVGGSLVPGIGGHNLLEPAYFNKPVLYGPYLTTYLSMAELLEKSGGGITVDGAEEIADSLRELLSNNLLKIKSGLGAGKVVDENRGALDKSVLAIEKLVFKKSRTAFPRS